MTNDLHFLWEIEFSCICQGPRRTKHTNSPSRLRDLIEYMTMELMSDWWDILLQSQFVLPWIVCDNVQSNSFPWQVKPGSREEGLGKTSRTETA